MSSAKEVTSQEREVTEENENIIFSGENVTDLCLQDQGTEDSLPLLKKVSRRWKALPAQGDDVTIKDPKLKQGYLGDLRKKSVIELEDVLRRQDTILSNKTLLANLPDRGERLRGKRNEVAKALEEVKEREWNLRTAYLPVDVQALEWRGINCNESQRVTTSKQQKDDEIDSDDENLDPLELMAQHSSCIKKKNHRKSWSEEEDPADVISRELKQMELRDALESANNEKEKNNEGRGESSTHRKHLGNEEEGIQNQVPSHSALDFGTKRIQMVEIRRLRNGEIREPFKPYRRLEHPQPIPGLQQIIDSHRPKSDRQAKMISLQESITLERSYLSKMKERELKKTVEALAQMKDAKMEIGLPPKASSLKYRDVNVGKHLLDSDEEDICYLPAHADDYDDDEEEFYGG